MPVPLRDNGQVGPTKRAIIFVHGFNSTTEQCWGGMLRLLRSDESVVNEFDILSFEYATALRRFAPSRLPSISEIGAELGSYLDRVLVDEPLGLDVYIDATLVGHSMGGLVIQSYLVQRLNAGGGRDLDRLRQAIVFATPNFGSDTLGLLRRLLSPVFNNPQEEALRAFSTEIRQLHDSVRDRVIDAQKRDAYFYPLPIYCFWGDSDAIVHEWSARGHFPHGEPLRGNHHDLHLPSGVNDAKYRAFLRALRHPHGHKNIWEVEEYRYSARVSPTIPGSVVLAKHGTKQRIVKTDNVAMVVRKIRFGMNNRCHKPFPLRYATRNEGWIDPVLPNHVTSPEKLRRYDDEGTEVIAEVDPDAHHPYTLAMKVYRGFETGHRSYHMHVGHDAYFRSLEFEVDLSDYVSAGWHTTDGPHLYFNPHDSGDHSLCANRAMLDPDPPHTYDPTGIWRWTLEHVKDGVVDIVWDVSPPGIAPIRESPSVIELGAGEHAIFGYGSLLSIASLQRTLKRPYTGPFVVCDVLGWRRTWNVVMPNEFDVYGFADSAGRLVKPDQILYLNISRTTGHRINGVLFVVTDDELRAFDKREWIYERTSVNGELRGVTVLGGSAWAFVGRPRYLVENPQCASRVAIRQSYLDILHAGKHDLGPEFAEVYDSSSDLPPQQLVVQDFKIGERREDIG